MSTQLVMLVGWTRLPRWRCQIEVQEREIMRKKELKKTVTEELRVLVWWTTETRRWCQWEVQETAGEET